MSRVCAVVGGRKMLFLLRMPFLGTNIVAPVVMVHPVRSKALDS